MCQNRQRGTAYSFWVTFVQNTKGAPSGTEILEIPISIFGRRTMFHCGVVFLQGENLVKCGKTNLINNPQVSPSHHHLGCLVDNYPQVKPSWGSYALFDDMRMSSNMATAKSSILIGCLIVNHAFWGTSIYGKLHMLMMNFPCCGLLVRAPRFPRETRHLQKESDHFSVASQSFKRGSHGDSMPCSSACFYRAMEHIQFVGGLLKETWWLWWLSILVLDCHMSAYSKCMRVRVWCKYI